MNAQGQPADSAAATDPRRETLALAREVVTEGRTALELIESTLARITERIASARQKLADTSFALAELDAAIEQKSGGRSDG